MESSEEDDDFPLVENITPQSKIDSLHQSHTEKGIRKLCCELLDLKDAVENLCGNTQTKYLAFLRMSEEVVEVDHELAELQKHISAHRILVQQFHRPRKNLVWYSVMTLFTQIELFSWQSGKLSILLGW